MLTLILNQGPFNLKEDNIVSWIQFQFERLLDIRFKCGSFMHKDSTCTKNAKLFIFDENIRILAFGKWLKLSLNLKAHVLQYFRNK